MPKIVEVDEEELLRLRRVNAVVGKIAQHPEAGTLLEQAHKFVDPDAPTPALERKKQLAEPIEAVRKEFEDYKKAQAEEKAKAEHEARIRSLSNQRDEGIARLRRAGWTDDGIKGVEQLMDEKGLLDVQDAADLFEKRNPPPPPSNPTGSGAWNFLDLPSGEAPDDQFVKRLLETKGQQDGVTDRHAQLALSELRGGRR
jgi:hypothetical protein